VAITVGGSPTSSAGGLASQLQVFAIGGSKAESPKPPGLTSIAPSAPRAPASFPAKTSGRGLAVQTQKVAGGARIAVPAGAVTLKLWNPNSSNLVKVSGKVLLARQPVSGAVVVVDRYTLPRTTGADGSFSALVDETLARRHPISVSAGAGTRIGGRSLTDAQKAALKSASGGINVGYRLDALKALKQSNRTIKVTGRAVRSDGVPVPPVVQLSYRLSGTITDATGKPVQGAYVVTRTNDRDYWVFSEPSSANGHYTSFFPASDLTDADPVEFAIQVAYGRTSYTTGVRNPTFKRRSSASLDLKLPASGVAMAVPTSTPEAGAIYRGLIVGVSAGKGVVKPVSATWPDAKGNFSVVLPASASGKILRLWQSDFQAYQTNAATPGGRIDLKGWPTGLSPRVARDTAFVRAPSPN
jgi:hypothetical protein